MSLTPEHVARIDAVLASLATEHGSLELTEAMSRLLPGVGLRRCDASDVLEEPFRRVACADLHLLDGSGHCILVTPDPADATALLIAARDAL